MQTKKILTQAHNELKKLINTLDNELRCNNLYIACQFNEDIDKLYELLQKINELIKGE